MLYLSGTLLLCLTIVCVGLVRWHAERRAAMSSVLAYRREVEREEGRGGVVLVLVWAGHEPQEFINLFPQWRENEDVYAYNTEVTIQ